MNGNSIISIWRLLSEISLLSLSLARNNVVEKTEDFYQEVFSKPTALKWTLLCILSSDILHRSTHIHWMESINLTNTFLHSLWRGATTWMSVNVVSALKALWLKHVISTESRRLDSVPAVYIKERSEIWKSSLWTQGDMTHIDGCLLCSVCALLLSTLKIQLRFVRFGILLCQICF